VVSFYLGMGQSHPPDPTTFNFTAAAFFCVMNSTLFIVLIVTGIVALLCMLLCSRALPVLLFPNPAGAAFFTIATT